jgi:hypothetical protein
LRNSTISCTSSFGFLDARYVLESDLVFVARKHARLRLAEIERALAGHANLLPEEKIEDEQEDGDRQETDERREKNVVLRFFLRNDARSLQGFLEVLVEVEIHLGPKRLDGGIRTLVSARPTANGVSRAIGLRNQFDGTFPDDQLIFHHFQEFRIRHVAGACHVRAEEEGAADQGNGHGKENHPAPVEIWILRGRWTIASWFFGLCHRMLPGKKGVLHHVRKRVCIRLPQGATT